MSKPTSVHPAEKTLAEGAATLLAAAKKNGATAAEVCGAFRLHKRVSLEKGDYQLASSDENTSFGLRVLKDGRLGFVCCNSADPDQLAHSAALALQIAAFSPANPLFGIEAAETDDGPLFARSPGDIWDASVPELPTEQLAKWTDVVFATSQAESRFRLNEASVNSSAAIALVANSQGVSRTAAETSVGWSMMGMGAEGDLLTSFDYFSGFQRLTAQVEPRIAEQSREFVERIVRQLTHGRGKSYRGLAVFSPRAVIDMLLGNIDHHLNGRHVLEKQSKWGLEQRDQRVLNAAITIEDLPWATDRGGFSRFDREGTPTRNRVMVQNGALRDWFLDRYAAKGLGLKTTGNAQGGPSSLPTAGAHSLKMHGGKTPLSALLADVTKRQGDFLLVDRFSGQVDPITGDFSGVAKGGDWWSGGERAFTVQETLISGNLFEVLGDALVALSAETTLVDGGWEAPALVADHVSVTAA